MGADIHAQDNYALRLSAYNGHLSVIKYLIEMGANIHANDDEALITSSENGYLPVIKLFNRNGSQYSRR